MPHFANLSFSQIRLHLKYKNEKKRGQQRKKSQAQVLGISYFIAIFRLGRKKNDPPPSRGAQIFFVDGVRLEKKKRQKKILPLAV